MCAVLFAHGYGLSWLVDASQVRSLASSAPLYPDQIPRKKRPRSRRSETRRSKSSPKQGDSFRGFRKGTAKERKTCSQREPVVGRSSENLPRRRRLVSVRRNTRPVWALQAAPGPAESKADSVGETAPTTRAKTPGVQGLGFRLQGSGFGVQGLGFRLQGSGFRV